MNPVRNPIVTITLNPAIDQTLQIPDFAAGKVNRVMGSESHAAGKGVNVAVTLADLGDRVIATGFIGAGNASLFERLLSRKQIDDQFVRVEGETRIGIKIVDGSTGETTDINFPGLTPTPQAAADLISHIEHLAAFGRWFVLAGSVPKGLPSEIYADLIGRIHSRGAHVALDASGDSLKYALDQGPDIAKPNIAELSELAGGMLSSPREVMQAAKEFLLARGVRLAVVSMGADGAVFIDRDHAIIARPPKVTVRSTVGAGDAMVAGLVHGKYHELDLERCAQLATALGAHAVTRVGAGMERRGEYEHLMADVRIEPVH